MGGVEVGTFKRLMSSIVESTMHDVRSQGQGVQQECGNSTTGPTQSSPFVFWCWLPPPMSVPAVGAGRPASGLDNQAQMCHFLVQGPHQPNV